MNMIRIMGLDYGSKTVGVAVSDSLGITAQGVETITRTDEGKLRRTLARIEELSKEYGISRIVLGYPKHEQFCRGTCKKDGGICRHGGTAHRASRSFLGRAPFYCFCRAGIDRKRSTQGEPESSNRQDCGGIYPSELFRLRRSR